MVSSIKRSEQRRLRYEILELVDDEVEVAAVMLGVEGVITAS
jgi:hypothetical protein